MIWCSTIAGFAIFLSKDEMSSSFAHLKWRKEQSFTIRSLEDNLLDTNQLPVL